MHSSMEALRHQRHRAVMHRVDVIYHSNKEGNELPFVSKPRFHRII
jgi:hypothetical protein